MENGLHAIWPQGLYREKNIGCLFLLQCRTDGRGFRLLLSAENNYRVHINGEFAGHGPSRCAEGRAHIDTFFLPDTSTEDCVIAVEVAAYNIAAITDAADPPFFAACVVNAVGAVCYKSEDFCAYRLTDAEQVVPRYSWQRWFLECYQMEHDRTRWYAGEVGDLQEIPCVAVKCPRLSPRNVPYPKYDKIAATETEEGRVTLDPTVPPFANRFLDERVGENGFPKEDIREHLVDTVRMFTYQKGAWDAAEPHYVLFDLGENRSGFFGLRLRAKGDACVVLVWDELLNSDGHIDPLRTNMANMLRVKVGKGEFLFESFQPYTARYAAAIVLHGEVEPTELYLRTYEHPHADRLQFTVEDAAMTSLLEAARRTLAQNAVDILTDCPSRERVGWLCDSYFIGAAEHLFCGENSVEHHFLENYAHAPQADYIPDGMISMSYPGYSNSKNFICNWALWYILELRAYEKRTGDREMIERSRPKVEGVLACLSKYENEEGLLEDPPGWIFVEWSRANDFVRGVNFPSNMLYCAALEAAADLYGGGDYAARAARIRRVLPKLSLGDRLFFCDHAVRVEGKLQTAEEDVSETCQYYAFYFGFADAERNEKLLRVLLTEFGCDRDEAVTYPQVAKSNAFIGNLLRLAYLSEHGFAAEALQQTVGYYLAQAERTGTLWEYTGEYKSCNHGFAAYIATMILRGLIGYDGTVGRTVRFLDTHAAVDCTFRIPLSAAEAAAVCVKDGVRTVDLPAGYRLSVIKGGENA